MFRRKPIYSQDDIDHQLSNIERLNKLRDICLQKVMVTRPDDVKYGWFASELERYTRNIETSQRLLDYMQELVARPVQEKHKKSPSGEGR